MALFGGVIVGILGAGLLSINPWLAGLLIACGYSYTAYCVHSSNSRRNKSLYFGFSISALIGLLIFLGECFLTPKTNWVIDHMADRSLLFMTFTFLPWGLAILKYFTSFRHSGRSSAVRP